MSLVEFRRRCEKIDHSVSNRNLPIRGNKVHTHSVSGDDYMLNDWYYSYYYFVLGVKKADGSDYAAADKLAIASDSASLIRKLEVKSNGKNLYDSYDLNYYMVTKNTIPIPNQNEPVVKQPEGTSLNWQPYNPPPFYDDHEIQGVKGYGLKQKIKERKGNSFRKLVIETHFETSHY